ncbi:MAG: hypothetical protein ACK4IK_09525 [Bacteroidia bacterium]
MLIKQLFIIFIAISVPINEQTERFNNLNALIKTYSKNSKDLKNKKLAIVVIKQQMCMYCVKKLYEYCKTNKSNNIVYLINEDIVNNNDEDILKNERNIIVPNAVIMRRDIGISSLGIVEVHENKIVSIKQLNIDNIDKNLNEIIKKYN